MGKLDDVKIVKLEGVSLNELSNEYSFRTPSGIAVEINTSPRRETDRDKFREGVFSYSVTKDGIGYPLAGGGLTQQSINEIRSALAKQKDIPKPIRREFDEMLDKAKVAPEPTRRIQKI